MYRFGLSVKRNQQGRRVSVLGVTPGQAGTVRTTVSPRSNGEITVREYQNQYKTERPTKNDLVKSFLTAFREATHIKPLTDFITRLRKNEKSLFDTTTAVGKLSAERGDSCRILTASVCHSTERFLFFLMCLSCVFNLAGRKHIVL